MTGLDNSVLEFVGKILITNRRTDITNEQKQEINAKLINQKVSEVIQHGKIQD